MDINETITRDIFFDSFKLNKIYNITINNCVKQINDSEKHNRDYYILECVFSKDDKHLMVYKDYNYLVHFAKKSLEAGFKYCCKKPRDIKTNDDLKISFVRKNKVCFLIGEVERVEKCLK